MGWSSEKAPGCEGYVIAIETPAMRFEREPWRGLGYVEISTHTHGQHRGELAIDCIQIGCECGWRSQRLVAPAGTVWAPSTVYLPEPHYDDVAYKLWRAHIDGGVSDMAMIEVSRAPKIESPRRAAGRRK